jgi:hypothetical protein
LTAAKKTAPYSVMTWARSSEVATPRPYERFAWPSPAKARTCGACGEMSILASGSAGPLAAAQHGGSRCLLSLGAQLGQSLLHSLGERLSRAGARARTVRMAERFSAATADASASAS